MKVGCVQLPVLRWDLGERRIRGQGEKRLYLFISPFSLYGTLQLRMWVWTHQGSRSPGSLRSVG